VGSPPMKKIFCFGENEKSRFCWKWLLMERCVECAKAVYPAERQVGADGKVYHSICWGRERERRKQGIFMTKQAQKHDSKPLAKPEESKQESKREVKEESPGHEQKEPTCFLVAKYAFSSDKEGELSYSKKDKFLLLSKRDNSPWWLARAADGRVGLVASNYVSELAIDAALERLAAAKETLRRSEAPPIQNPPPAWSDDEQDDEGIKEAAEGVQKKVEDLKGEEEALAKKMAEEELAKKKAEEEAALAKKKAEEEALAKKKAEEEALAKKKAEEEALAKKKAEEEAALAKKSAEEEAERTEKAHLLSIEEKISLHKEKIETGSVVAKIRREGYDAVESISEKLRRLKGFIFGLLSFVPVCSLFAQRTWEHTALTPPRRVTMLRKSHWMKSCLA
jgi:hypothetical protein